MTAKAVELADAIVTAINAGTYVLDFDAQRRAAPFTKLEELKDLQVAVFCGTRATATATRGSFLTTYKPVVFVGQKLPSKLESERLDALDDLQELVEAIESELSSNQNLADMTLQSFNEEQDNDPYNIDILKQNGAFATAIALEYLG